MANGLVRLIIGWRTIRRTTVAETRVAATVVLSAFGRETKTTLSGTAWTLRGKETER